MDTPLATWATAALARERPNMIDFMMEKEGGDSVLGKSANRKSREKPKGLSGLRWGH